MPCEECPICLETLVDAEELFQLPCLACEYNFCTRCVDEFVRSSNDDYQEASDGSRQVKVRIACPQCRSKYAMDLDSVVLLRKAFALGNAIYDKEGNRLDDSELTATILSLKRDFWSSANKRRVEIAHGLYLQVMDGKISHQLVENAEEVWRRLFAGVPSSPLKATASKDSSIDSNGEEDPESDDENADDSAGNLQSKVDDSLFQGLEDCMGSDEKVFLTDFLTSGNVSKLNQAAMILHGILKLSYMRPNLNSNQSLRDSQKNADRINKIKTTFPLPNHMPGYFLIPSYDSKQKFLSLDDMVWNGTIIPPQRSKRVFDQVYEGHYRKPSEARKVVIVKTVRGPAGRVGLRKADVITHVNDMEWQGDAKELQAYIYELHGRHPGDEITLTVNCNPETGLFLKIRHDLLKQAKTLS